MMLVTGYSGIGKTSLIQELYKPIVRQRGYFISGKFDQVVRSVPFGGLIQAFRGLVRQLLTESFVLATIGTLVGVVLGAVGLRALLAFGAAKLPQDLGTRLDPSVRGKYAELWRAWQSAPKE